MTYTPKMTIKHKFNQAELDSIFNLKVQRYKTSVESVGADKGAMISVFDDYGLGFLRQLESYFAQGYKLADNPLPEVQPRFQRAFLVKPEPLQKSDIKQLKIDAEREYQALLQTRYEQHLAAIVAESKQRYETEQRKRAEQETKELEEKWLQEAMNVLGKAPAAEENV